MTPIETLFSFRLAEAINYVTNCWRASNVYTFFVVMNTKTWDALSEEHQDIFNDISSEFMEKSAQVWNEVDVRGYEQGTKEGVEFITLSPEEMARWEEAVQPVIEDKIDKLVEAGHSRDKVMEMIEFIQERTEHWTQKQIEKGIKSPTGPAEMMMD